MDFVKEREFFEREGYLVLPGVLSASEADTLRAEVERVFGQHSDEAAAFDMQASWRPKMFEHGEVFERLIDHPGLIGLIEALLGSDCHVIAMSAMSTASGEEISTWHADEGIRFPLPPQVQLDPRITPPCFVINVNYYLNDVDEAMGPTEFVPGSQRAGRQPGRADRDRDGNPVYEGRSIVRAPGARGTVVLWNDQVWHRGGLNTSGHRRWVQQISYGRRFIAQRFYPFINYRLPAEILARSNPRRRRLLGVHEHGAYG